MECFKLANIQRSQLQKDYLFFHKRALSFKKLWAKEDSLANFLRLKVLLNQKIDDSCQLLIYKSFAIIFHAKQDVAKSIQDTSDLKNNIYKFYF